MYGGWQQLGTCGFLSCTGHNGSFGHHETADPASPLLFFPPNFLSLLLRMFSVFLFFVPAFRMATMDVDDVPEQEAPEMEVDELSEAARLQAMEVADPQAAMAAYAASIASPTAPEADKVAAFQRVAPLYVFQLQMKEEEERRKKKEEEEEESNRKMHGIFVIYFLLVSCAGEQGTRSTERWRSSRRW